MTPLAAAGSPQAAALPATGAGVRRRAWRDGPLACRTGSHATLFLDRHGYVTGTALPGEVPVGWHLAELYSAECASRRDPDDDLRAASRHGSVDLEGWWERAGGSRCWVEATLTALRGAAGAVAGFALVVRDASAARQAEEALRLSEARLAGIVDLARDAIVSADDAQEIILFNRGAERIFGYGAAEVLGGSVERLFAAAYREWHAGEVLALSLAGRARREGDLGEVAARRADGSVFPAAASLSSVEVGGRRVYTWVLRDVTADKRAAAESAFLLRAGSALASSLDPGATLETAAALGAEGLSGLCLAHAAEREGQPRRTAAAAVSPAGQALARALEARPYDLGVVEPVAGAVRSGEPRCLAFSGEAALSGAGWLPEHADALSAAGPGVIQAFPLAVHGRILGALVLVRSGGCALAADDLRLIAELAGRAARALESALLYERACRAVRMRDEMVSVVSHDLRNPLSAIMMTAAMLMEPGPEPPLSPGRAKLVEMIRRSGERMSHMVGDLLDVARIEAGRLGLDARPLAPSSVLAEAELLQRAEADAAGITLVVVESGGPLPAVWGDPDRLQQVFANLVGNALKFTPRGGSITLSGDADPEGGVRFTVRDTGAGIPAADLPYVFDRFWQVGRADRRGLGLGLPIVKGIVEVHGGRVWAESEPGRGSAFHFTVPAAPAGEAGREA